MVSIGSGSESRSAGSAKDDDILPGLFSSCPGGVWLRQQLISDAGWPGVRRAAGVARQRQRSGHIQGAPQSVLAGVLGAARGGSLGQSTPVVRVIDIAGPAPEGRRARRRARLRARGSPSTNQSPDAFGRVNQILAGLLSLAPGLSALSRPPVAIAGLLVVSFRSLRHRQSRAAAIRPAAAAWSIAAPPAPCFAPALGRSAGGGSGGPPVRKAIAPPLAL
jgi:hypothetical protein